MFEDRAGTLWVGTDSGLDRQDADTGHFRHFRSEPADPASLSHSRVQHVFETRSGQLWIGTAGGLNRLDTTSDGGVRFRRYTHQDGLAADSIGAILPDASGALWISTTAGISRFEPSSGRFRNYSARDGLIDSGYYVGSDHASSDGTLYFGGLSGLTAFRPEAIRDNSIPPPVVITELQIFNRAVLGAARPDGVRFEGVIETATTLRLSHANAVFSLEFAALHFADPRRNRYAYQLVGFDPDWIETDSSRRFVTYTNLAPGDYTFRVKAANKDGIWNNTGSAIDIHVEPPYWATWWFRTLLAAFLLGSVWAVIRYRVRGLTRQRAWLQQQVAARTAEVVRQKEDIEQAHGNLAVLGEIGREITASLDETAIFQTLDRHVHGLLDATTFGIYLLDADAKGLTSAWRVEGGEALPVRQVALDAPDANLARCARERSELLVEYSIEEAKDQPSRHCTHAERTVRAPGDRRSPARRHDHPVAAAACLRRTRKGDLPQPLRLRRDRPGQRPRLPPPGRGRCRGAACTGGTKALAGTGSQRQDRRSAAAEGRHRAGQQHVVGAGRDWPRDHRHAGRGRGLPNPGAPRQRPARRHHVCGLFARRQRPAADLGPACGGRQHPAERQHRDRPPHPQRGSLRPRAPGTLRRDRARGVQPQPGTGHSAHPQFTVLAADDR
ncbi:MAG: hypothetical protein IPO66_11900 [Rhodanobacteraceae bacterium]|nr:hypothetical protein [Rhodanobacteraceae bacterium]